MIGELGMGNWLVGYDKLVVVVDLWRGIGYFLENLGISGIFV